MKRRILIVDDDASVRESLKKVLEGADYEVLLSADGAEATARFETEHVDLLLLDVKLPDLSGWDVFERLTTRRPIVPVIIITGLPLEAHMAQIVGAGAFFEKPLDVSALLQRVKELLAEPPERHLERLCGHVRDIPHVTAAGKKASSLTGQSVPPVFAKDAVQTYES